MLFFNQLVKHNPLKIVLQNNAYLQFISTLIATNSTMCPLCALVLLYDGSQTKGREHISFFTHKQVKEPFQCAHKVENLHFHDSIRLNREYSTAL